MSIRTTHSSLGLAVLAWSALALVGGGCASTGSGGQAVEAGPEQGLRGQMNRGDELFDGRAYEQAIEVYSAVYLAARSRDLTAFECEAAAQIATAYATLDRASDGDVWMQRAEGVASESDRLAWSRLMLARGMRFYKARDVRSAGATFKALYNFCILHAQAPRAIQAATLASLASIGQDQLDWSHHAIQAAHTTGELGWESDLWGNHGWLLDERGEYDEALEAFERARDLASSASVSRLKRLQTDWAYGHGLRMVGRLDESRDLLDRSLAIARSIYIQKPSQRAAEYLGRVLWELGEVDATEGEKDRARERFLAARDKLIEAGAVQGAPRLVRELDQRIEALDAPEPMRRIPSKQEEERAKRRT